MKYVLKEALVKDDKVEIPAVAKILGSRKQTMIFDPSPYTYKEKILTYIQYLIEEKYDDT